MFLTTHPVTGSATDWALPNVERTETCATAMPDDFVIIKDNKRALLRDRKKLTTH